MPRVKSKEIGRRSGRFEFTPTGGSRQVIVSSAPDARKYRVHNTGSNKLSVSPGGDIGARSSLDVEVATDTPLEVHGTNDKLLEGVYDRIDIPRTQVRSGQFRYLSLNEIIASGSGLYRFFNTRRIGVARISIGVDDHDISSGCTMDISVSSAVSARGSGVYDRLDMGTEVRSGHFRTSATIDIAVMTTASTYRFFNTGGSEYAVKLKDGTVDIAKVQSFSSVDMVLPVGTIEVVAGALIKGAYDFIE